MKFEGVLAACVLGAVVVACQQNGAPASEVESSTESALTASQQCLRQASNEDLLAEVSARMSGGTSSGGSTNAGAIGTYSCDSSTYLHVSVVAPDGTEKTAQVYVGGNDACQQTASALNRSRHDIARTMLAGVCDSSTYLNRFSLTAAGGLQTLPKVYVGSSDGCTQQQNDMNR